ncbi:hypothetical protein JOC77_004299 [Peribacillus deserti]|uniref:Uncharacterized protein n=1 Tax=Peribacillus deserti TaxID=673318 RepID=A0ABS2QNT2_9BACI|nr:hypothetical protein [Peribacillus deserti]MBM7694820.1 hypothetical protein [Peribacillus deserti]
MVQNFHKIYSCLEKSLHFQDWRQIIGDKRRRREELDSPRKWVQEHAIISPAGLAELETLQARPRFDAVLRVVNTFGWDIIIC